MSHPLGEEAQRRPRAIDGGATRHPSAIGGDAQAAQPESHGRDAADVPRRGFDRRAVRPGTVAHDAGCGIGVFPEKLEGPFRQIFQQRVVGGREERALWRRLSLRRRHRAAAGAGARCEYPDREGKNQRAKGAARNEVAQWCGLYRRRRTNFWILPVAVFGSSARNVKLWGVLKCAS